MVAFSCEKSFDYLIAIGGHRETSLKMNISQNLKHELEKQSCSFADCSDKTFRIVVTNNPRAYHEVFQCWSILVQKIISVYRY